MKAIGFDFDHTLGVDNKVERVAFVDVVSDIALKRDQVIDLQGAYAAIDREIQAYRAGTCSLADALSIALRTVFGANGIPSNAAADFRERAVQMAPQYVQPLPGVAELLGQLNRMEIPYAVLTNGWNPLQQRKADAIGFDRPVLVSDDLGVRKPEAAAFEKLAEVLQVPPSAVCYVGDDPRIDCGGALAAGMQAVWFDWEARVYPDDIPRPSATVHRLIDVSTVLTLAQT